MVSPSSSEAAAKKLGLSKVKVATPVEPSRERVSFTSGTHGSGKPIMNSMYAAGAVAAVASSGIDGLVAALVRDRVARSAEGSAASLLVTWERFHDIGFVDAAVPVPLLPITDRSLMVVGALFKSGG